MPQDLEAKIVVLGAQGVGKTSLVMRYCKGSFDPATTVSTVGASFMTKRVVDSDTDSVVRLQIWDTGKKFRISLAPYSSWQHRENGTRYEWTRMLTILLQRDRNVSAPYPSSTTEARTLVSYATR